MTNEIDDNTNDVILGFFDGDEYIGGADIEPIRYGEKLLDELNDSIDDFDGRALRRYKLDGGAYLQDTEDGGIIMVNINVDNGSL